MMWRLSGLAGMVGTGSRVAITLYLTLLAEAELLAGRIEAGLFSVDEALRANPQERFFRPGSLHLRGILYDRTGRTDDAKRDYREAMRLSAEMGAKVFYVRAEQSLQISTKLSKPG
jgi:Tfp pilus assembly protein PilF